MRKLFILIPLLLAACGGYQTLPVTLPGGFVVKAELADTPEKAEKGLMFRENLPGGRGMLFIFDADAPRLFWMKNTFIDLDIIFINSDKTIHSVAANVPRSYSYTPDHQVAYAQGFGQYVLELPAGSAAKHGLKPGAIVEF